MKSQHDLVTQQFAPVAAAYATSPTHSDVAVLADLVAVVEPKADEEALDIATGAGNLALALAPHVRKVTALDLTPTMLEETARRAVERGIGNLETVEAPAESLPFPNESFDIVAVRTAPHHYADIVAAVKEMSRVVRTGGRVLIVDTYAPEDALLSAELHRFEKLRDPSHVRNYQASEWRAMVLDAGLTITYERCDSHALGKRLIFSEWAARMNVSEENSQILRGWLLDGSMEFKKLLDVKGYGDDLSFTLPEITLLAEPASR